MSIELTDLYIQYAETISQLNDSRKDVENKNKLLSQLKKNINTPESDGSFAIEFSDHAFKQISKRFEELMVQSDEANKDILKTNNKLESLLLWSNLESFIFTLLASARKKEQFKKQRSKSGGFEYHIYSDIKKWSNEKKLQFVGIVENNCLKTGFFNWV